MVFGVWILLITDIFPINKLIVAEESSKAMEKTYLKSSCLNMQLGIFSPWVISGNYTKHDLGMRKYIEK